MNKESKYYVHAEAYHLWKRPGYHWEVDIYRKRRFWFDKLDIHRADTTLTLEDAKKAITKFLKSQGFEVPGGWEG